MTAIIRTEPCLSIGTIFVKEGKEDRTANTPAPMAKTMQMVFPEIEKTTRLLKTVCG